MSHLLNPKKKYVEIILVIFKPYASVYVRN